MKELFRTNDPVRLSWAGVLREPDREPGARPHTSIIEGNIGAIPRRLMVRRAISPAPAHCSSQPGGRPVSGAPAAAEPALSEDRLLGGRVRLRQPAKAIASRSTPCCSPRRCRPSRSAGARCWLRHRRGDVVPGGAGRRTAASPASTANATWFGSPATIYLERAGGARLGDDRRSVAAAAPAGARHLRPRHG